MGDIGYKSSRVPRPSCFLCSAVWIPAHTLTYYTAPLTMCSVQLVLWTCSCLYIWPIMILLWLHSCLLLCICFLFLFGAIAKPISAPLLLPFSPTLYRTWPLLLLLGPAQIDHFCTDSCIMIKGWSWSWSWFGAKLWCSVHIELDLPRGGLPFICLNLFFKEINSFLN